MQDQLVVLLDKSDLRVLKTGHSVTLDINTDHYLTNDSLTISGYFFLLALSHWVSAYVELCLTDTTESCST